MCKNRRLTLRDGTDASEAQIAAVLVETLDVDTDTDTDTDRDRDRDTVEEDMYVFMHLRVQKAMLADFSKVTHLFSSIDA